MLKGWNSDRRRLVAGLALVLFGLRALVPIGFMLSVGPSQAAVTLCPDFGPLPFSAGAHHHHHVHGAGAGSGLQLPGADGHSPCPFAAAGHSDWQAPVAADGLDADANGTPSRVRAAGIRFPETRLELFRAPRGPPSLNLA